MSRRSGLGRGLNSLIPQGTAIHTGSRLQELPLSAIRPNQYQPRTHFDEESLATLVDSIKAVGILQPVLVRQVAEQEYELIAGERRMRAAKRAGLGTIPALVQSADDASSLEQALVENLHREDLNPMDEAGAYQQLIEDFHLTHEEVARKVGKSRVAITNSLRLFQLPPTVQRHVRDNRLSAGHARALLGTPDRALQEELAGETIQAGLSVRAVEERVRLLVRAVEDPSSELEQASMEAEERAPVVEPHSVGGIGRPEGATPVEPSGRRESDQVRRLPAPGVLDLEEMLGDYLNTRVSVDVGGKRGRVVIEFANLDDLERIYRRITGEPTD